MKLTIKESNKVVLEVNKGYSAEVYNALDSDFKSEWDNKVDANYLTDQVELWLYNTEELEREIYNTRRKPHSIAYAAMLDLFQDVVMRYSNRKIQVTSDMAKRWLAKNGLKYEEVLAPIVARIEEDRADNRKTESFTREDVDVDVKKSVRSKRSRKSRMTESDDVVDRRGFVSLVKLNNYGSYSVLNDGYFVIKILADDDSDAKRQFNDFLSTDWKSDWKNGTLPKYYDE
jgi:hypothetical protein